MKQYLACYRRTRGSANAVVRHVTSVEPVPAHSTSPSYPKGLLVRAPSNIVSGDVRNQGTNVERRVLPLQFEGQKPQEFAPSAVRFEKSPDQDFIHEDLYGASTQAPTSQPKFKESEYHRVSLHSRPPDYTDAVMPSHQNYPTQIAHGNRAHMTYGDPSKANSVHNYFKDRKFTVYLKQSFENFLRDYAVCSCQQQLTPQQERDYFVNCLKGSARTHFFNDRGGQLVTHRSLNLCGRNTTATHDSAKPNTW